MVLFFSMARLVSPLKRGDMLTVCILIYVLTGGIAGYNAARIHRKFRGTEWIKVGARTRIALFCADLVGTFRRRYGGGGVDVYAVTVSRSCASFDLTVNGVCWVVTCADDPYLHFCF